MSEELIQKLTSIELEQASIHSRALSLSDRLNKIESGWSCKVICQLTH